MSNKTRLYHIIIAEFLFLIGFAMMIPLLPLFARDLGASATLIGGLLAANQGVDFLYAPVAGRLSDRLGRRVLLLPAMLLTALAYFAISKSSSISVLFIVWTVAGFGSSHVLLSQAYVADVTSESKRAAGMGYWGAAFAMAFVIGPPLGATLYSRNPDQAAMLAAGISMLATLYAFIFVPEPEPANHHDVERSRSLRRLSTLKRSVVTIIVLNFALIFMWSQFTTILPLYSQDVFAWKVSTFGIYLGVIGLVAAIVQGLLIGWLVKKVNYKILVSAGFGLLGSGLAFLTAPTTGWTLALSVLGIAVGFGLLIPSLPALLSVNVHPDRKGLALGIFQSASTLARVIAPLVAGLVYENVLRSAPFISMAILGLTIMVVTSLVSVRKTGKL